MTIRVVYCGTYTYPWCSEVHIARSLETLGCEVLRLPEHGASPASIEQAANDFGADLVLYTRTARMPGALTDVWRRLEANGTVTASYHLDLYLGLAREETLAGDPFWATQWVFSPDGDPAAEERFADLGINHVWSPPAVVHDECVPGTRSGRYAFDVAFVGSERYLPEWPWRGELIAWLRAHYPGFMRFGNGSEVVRDEKLNDLYASVGVAVGDSLCQGFTHERYVSDRLFEAGGRGAVQLFPRVPGIDAFGFVDGEHLLFYDYGDYNGIAERIAWALDEPEEARAMAKRGQEYIAAHHTYLDRLAIALYVMGLRKSPDRPNVTVTGFAQSTVEV